MFADCLNHTRPRLVWRLNLSIITLLLFLGSVTGFAKSALVIGNSAYDSAPLANPVNDATDIAEKLRALDFEVSTLTNASRRDMRRAIREYSERLRTTGGVGLFYYAGHGMQIKGVNYLIPTDAIMQSEFEIPDEAVSANSVLRALEEAGNDLNIVILDACRDNPFAKSYRSASTRGLARMDAPGGSIIAYATAPGNTAMDGSGRNGVYTKHLLANMDKPGMAIEQMFKKVRIGVIDESGGQQTPWEESSLRSDFYFAPAKVVEVALPDNRPATQTVSSSLASQPIAVAAISSTPANVTSTDLQSPTQADVEALLASAYAAMRDYRLTTPARDNALYYYREVLKLDPVNFDAHSGLQSITRRYISYAEQEIRNSDIDKAESYIARGMKIHPDNPRLQELKREADELRVLQTMLAARQDIQESIQATAPEVYSSAAPVGTRPIASGAAVDSNALQTTTAPTGVQDDGAEASVDEVATMDSGMHTPDDQPTTRTGQMKKEFKRDVDEIKSSIMGIGQSIKSGIGGLLAKKKDKEPTTK